MSEGMLSKHATLNAGTIPASAEELSQRYLKLFQQYSRLKAQHAVLKKAVIKEQATNVALQGNVREKEKELRKLQEQLDLLAFHNERLTKRIQAVQESDQKGTHFSLLGGSVKKELEKSAQALDEANMDLERKIEENEKLHEELTERQFEFTESINKLLQQIQDLEKREAELQDENANLQAETKNHSGTTINETTSVSHQQLITEIESLKKELHEKNALLDEKNQQAQQNDAQMLAEIQSLRAILLAKIGHLNKDESTLYDIVPAASDALRALEVQANQYILSNGQETDMKELPSEIAEKLAISAETYSKELLGLLKQLDDTKTELGRLLAEKDQEISSYREKNQQHEQDLEQRIQAQNDKIEGLLATIETNQKKEVDVVSNLEAVNKNLENENAQLQKELELQRSNLESIQKELHDTKELTRSKDTLDKEIQVDYVATADKVDVPIGETPQNTENETEKKEEKEVHEVFVYPNNPTNEQKAKEEEDEEVFVYRGMDAVPATSPSAPEKIYSEEDILKREAKMKAYYEQQLGQLTEKIQMTDSKALRFASMYTTLKDRLIQEDKERQMMVTEIERLNKEVKNVQDLLATTESNYQKQVDSMTEFISSLQESQEEQSRPQRRSNNYNV
ncbi:hypothetical protein [Parasitella parasitica]|uniref:Protein phosphatase 1 regulatory subunit 21 N-terminal domain-containing protein n=1 Tax=Parasitella parasitica TaxID=35722 RepID=A0A0B7NF07_9FUNG|nr:hypothetical protein [Parasitella parasitica]